MARVSQADVIEIAGKAFFEEGYSQLSIPTLVQRAGTSESTLRRLFPKGKGAIYQAVMERAAQHVHRNFVENVSRMQLDVEHSDSALLALCYFDSTVSLWKSKGDCYWAVGLLFGYDGSSGGGDDLGSDFVTETMTVDIELLDRILERGCRGDIDHARNLACILLGTLCELVKADLDEESGYKRSYRASGISAILLALLKSSMSENPSTIAAKSKASIPTTSLAQLSSSLRETAVKQKDIAAQIDRMLKDQEGNLG